jgi:predicted phosphoribosyltransferase
VSDRFRFRDRRHAGQFLAARLGAYAGRSDVQVLALPRGGVPVAFEVARALKAPLDAFIVRKLGVPGHEECASGAIATGGVCVLDEELVTSLRLRPEVVDQIIATERRELERRERAYRDDRPPPPVAGRTVIIVDDGLATGSTMLAAVRALRIQTPTAIVVAVPTGADETCQMLQPLVDELVCVSTPVPFRAVGLSYDDFSATTDDEVLQLLATSIGGSAAPVPA